MSTVVVFAACEPGDPGRSTGAYPIDIFQEMHYNQSLKAQEPPRFAPPAGSIPVTGGYIPAPAKADAADLVSPFAADLTRGALLYKQNCSMCHGQTARGDDDGAGVGDRLAAYAAPQPPAFDSDRITELTAGEAYASIANGFGFMPPFQGLLTEEDRWALVAIVEASVTDRNRELEAVNDVDELERTLRLLRLRGVVK